VEHLNRVIQKLLGEKAPVPMMIVKNNHSLGVNNGDVGVVMPNDDTLYLLNEDKTVRRIPLALLPDREMAFASTIHKAQGSEYDDVIIVMPPTAEAEKSNPLLTREILYTAITRTKKQVFLYSDDASIKTCCQNCIKRQTGLAIE
jgi:exodeoxyribonuclease V alpha subunit